LKDIENNHHGLTEHELQDLSSETFQSTLQHFLKTFVQKKGIEKNLFVKKFIKEIIYSKENIQINLYFSRNFALQDFSDLNS